MEIENPTLPSREIEEIENPTTPSMEIENPTLPSSEIEEIENPTLPSTDIENPTLPSTDIENPTLPTMDNALHNPSIAPVSYWTQANALFRKNLTMQKRRKKETILLLLIPVLLCLILFATKNWLARKAKQGKQFPPGHGCSYSELLNNFPQCEILRPYEYPPLLYIPKSDNRAIQTSFLPLADLPDGACKKSESCPATVLFTGSNKSLATDLARRIIPKYSILNPSNILNSFANGVFGSTSEGEISGSKLYIDPAFSSFNPIYNIQRRCHRNSSSFIWKEFNSRKIVIKCIKGLSLWRNSSSKIDDEIFMGFPEGNSEKMTNEIVAAYDFLNSSDQIFNVNVWYKSSTNDGSQLRENAFMRVARLVNLASNAYLGFRHGTNFKILFEFVKEMPKHPDSPEIDHFISGYYPQFFTSIVLELILVILTSLVNEKEEKTRIMMKVHGLGDGAYWAMTYVYFLALSFIYMFCFLATCLVLEIGSFRENDYALQLVFFFVYINLQVAFSFLVARMFSKVRTTSVVAYPIVFATGLVGKFCMAAKVGDPSFPGYLATIMELYPGLSLFRIFLEFSVRASEARLSHGRGMTWEDLNDGSNGLKEVLIIMVAEWVFFLIVSYCLDNKSSIQSSLVENANVVQEREKVEEFLVQPNRSYSIICKNLKKVYPGKDGNPAKVAVNGLSLALKRGECFGMLGPDGAGKSSFINMMIGLTKPTSGTAFIEGLNIRKDMERVYNSMGVCPEHDLLWETLTAREHLYFYGRLKNLKGLALHQAVEESLSTVNLLSGGIADKQAGEYSRCMKRRLSVAISLIGDPKVVYMDELSTGLDPVSRRELWNIVKHAKANRAIILTTHSTKEAEHVCDRIGLFLDGSLQCIGDAKQLKLRYAGYYVLTITVTSMDNEQEVERLVSLLCPSASKIYYMSGTQKFELPKNEVRMVDVVKMVLAAKTEFPVVAWSLADATLEDVVLKVAFSTTESQTDGLAPGQATAGLTPVLTTEGLASNSATGRSSLRPIEHVQLSTTGSTIGSTSGCKEATGT